MKRVSKFDRAHKLAVKLVDKPTIATIHGKFSPNYVKTLIRQAYMKGHKAGMARHRRIAKAWSD